MTRRFKFAEAEVVITINRLTPLLNGKHRHQYKAALSNAGLTEEQMRSRRRDTELVSRRWLCFVALARLGWSVNKISEVTGKDRSSVRNGLKQLEVKKSFKDAIRESSRFKD